MFDMDLKLGENINLFQYLYHQFYDAKRKSWVLVGKVSYVTGNEIDSRFLDTIGRYLQIEEDKPPIYCIYNEYS